MNRSPQEGWPATFMLVRNADSKIVSVMQAEDQLDYRARVKMMMSKCDA